MHTLDNYRSKLTPGTVLGLSYAVDDPAYGVTRALPIQQLTVVAVQTGVAVFQKLDGHQLRVDLHARLAFLRFGSAPYQPDENIWRHHSPDRSSQGCRRGRSFIACSATASMVRDHVGGVSSLGDIHAQRSASWRLTNYVL